MSRKKEHRTTKSKVEDFHSRKRRRGIRACTGANDCPQLQVIEEHAGGESTLNGYMKCTDSPIAGREEEEEGRVLERKTVHSCR